MDFQEWLSKCQEKKSALDKISDKVKSQKLNATEKEQLKQITREIIEELQQISTEELIDIYKHYLDKTTLEWTQRMTGLK